MKIDNDQHFMQACKRLKGWLRSFRYMKKRLGAYEWDIYRQVYFPLVEEILDEMREYMVEITKPEQEVKDEKAT